MGGIGSGAQRSTHVADVEDVFALDIRALRRLGALRPGECVITPVCWTKRALSAPSGHLRIDVSEAECCGTMTINARMPGGKVAQHVTIDAVPARLGGHRTYFVCPVTDERCEVLYYLHGRFASRRAQRLSYAVQSMDEIARSNRKAAKIRRRLQGEGGLPRPRGRHRIDLVKRLHEAEGRARSLYCDRLCVLAERSGARRVPSGRTK